MQGLRFSRVRLNMHEGLRHRDHNRVGRRCCSLHRRGGCSERHRLGRRERQRGSVRRAPWQKGVVSPLDRAEEGHVALCAQTLELHLGRDRGGLQTLNQSIQSEKPVDGGVAVDKGARTSVGTDAWGGAASQVAASTWLGTGSLEAVTAEGLGAAGAIAAGVVEAGNVAAGAVTTCDAAWPAPARGGRGRAPQVHAVGTACRNWRH